MTAKKDILRDAVVIVNLDPNLVLDADDQERVAQSLEKIEPSAFYLINGYNLSIEVIGKQEFKNKSLRIMVKQSDNISMAARDDIQQMFQEAFKDAKDIEVVFLPDYDVQIK